MSSTSSLSLSRSLIAGPCAVELIAIELSPPLEPSLQRGTRTVLSLLDQYKHECKIAIR